MCVSMCVYVYMCICVCVYVCMCICVHVLMNYMNACIRVCKCYLCGCRLGLTLTNSCSGVLDKLIVAELGNTFLVLLWNPKLRYHGHKSPPPVPDVNQMNSVDTSQLRTCFNI
jgi:hypothetical protein